MAGLLEAKAELELQVSKDDNRFLVRAAPLEEELHLQKLRISELEYEGKKQELQHQTLARRNDFLEVSSRELTETVKALTNCVAELKADKVAVEERCWLLQQEGEVRVEG